MTNINEIGNKETVERLRGEILANVETRRDEAQKAFSGLAAFLGLIYSGASIGILSFIGGRVQSGVPTLAVGAFALFAAALMSFALFYHLHSQLHAKRAAHYAVVAQRFFTRESSLEDVLASGSNLQAAWLYRLIFWVPFGCALAGFLLGVLAALGYGPVIMLPEA